MPRFARLAAPDSIHHIIGRCVNKEFRIAGAPERHEYLRRVPLALGRCDWIFLGYALMSNHVHLGCLAGQTSSASFVQPLHGGYAQWLNTHQGKLGPVFAERHGTRVLPEEQLARLLAYIHNNTVRAGLVRDAVDSDWTSHQAYLGLVLAPPWLDVERGLSMAGFSSSASGRLAFHEYVKSRRGDLRDPTLSDDVLELRAAVRRETGAPVEVSSPQLVTDGSAATAVMALPGTPLRPRWPGSVESVIACVAAQTRMSASVFRSRVRTAPVVAARRVCLMVWVYWLAREQCEMSAALGLARSSASELLSPGPATAKLADFAQSIGKALWTQFPNFRTPSPVDKSSR
jgi:hypothetical protein